MIRKSWAAASLLFMGAMQAFGGDVSGTWNLKVNMGRDATFVMKLKQTGDSVAGSVSTKRKEFPIERGSVDANNNVNIVLGGEGRLAGCRITGKLEGDHSQVTLATDQGEVEGVAEKAK